MISSFWTLLKVLFLIFGLMLSIRLFFTAMAVEWQMKNWVSQPIRKALKTPEFVLSEAIYFRTKKASRRRTSWRGCAHLWQKPSVPDNTYFVDVGFLQTFFYECSNKMAMIIYRRRRKTSVRSQSFRWSCVTWRGTMEKLPPDSWVTFDGYTNQSAWKSSWG